MNKMNSKKKKVKGKFWLNKFVEFCQRTDLHGYKYIVMKELNLAERCCWSITLLTSTALAAYFVVTAYKWYARNPIVTVIESTHGMIWDIPFPAVTICDLNQISFKRARYFSNTVDLPPNMTSEELFLALKFAPMLYNPAYVTEEHKGILYDLQQVLDLNHISVQDLFNRVGPLSCNNLLQRCIWKNTVYRCDMLFQRVYTHQALCCSFNYYALEGPNNSSLNHAFRPITPRRVAACGYQTALSVLINIEVNDYYSAVVSSYGVLVYIDNAYNQPNLNSPSRLINPTTEVFVALTPERTYATSGVARFDVDIRQCFYATETKIGRFNRYSYHNCMAYRSIVKILKSCGCLPFFFSEILDTNRTCDFRDIDCLQKFKQVIDYQSTVESDIKCLPDCEHYDYPFEMAMGILSNKVPINNMALFKEIETKNHSVLNVFFNDLVSTRYRRDVYLNWQNLLASFGGLMSLMLGFTLISGFDLIIFLLFRIILAGSTNIVHNSDQDTIDDNKISIENDASLNKDIYDSERYMRNNWIANSSTPKSNMAWSLPPRYEDAGRFKNGKGKHNRY